MKKLISVCLIALILFNALGFYGVLVGVHYSATKEILSRFDNDDLRKEETFIVKLPLAIPYAQNTDFVRIDGEFMHEGNVFRLVKQKFEFDTLHIVCMSDAKATQVQKALAEYVKTFTDNPVQSSSGSKLPVTFVKDYLPVSFEVCPGSTGWNYKLPLTQWSSNLVAVSLPVSNPPPQG